ncbi:substrate-binding domain-containing protein [Paucibacter sp. APW11]|uniref:Substrate-binding domain-containing protein n=1 Tax=Roseateles aquae TaxID=3077235 RepID=A0ABU3PAZ9_9BURK|nr:substrate-binding domain-containing protein [Paucibacter sp. APW11]MDT8999762.1 substrate-binding domain-containing protein [Paucibacter sp. APW11]
MKTTMMSLALIAALAATPASADNTLIVIAHKDVAVERLSAETVTQIFLRQQQNWPDGQPIQPIDQKESTPLRRQFYLQLTGRSPGQLRSYWARQSFTGMGLPPRQADSDEEVSRLVQATPGAIGYVSRRPTQAGIKVLLNASAE